MAFPAGRKWRFQLSSTYVLPFLAVLMFVGISIEHNMMLHSHSSIHARNVVAKTIAPAPSPPVKLGNLTDLRIKEFELADCINSHQPEHKKTTWKSAMSTDNFTAVSVHKVWLSNKSARAPMTVVTQLSFDRVEQLIQQCKSWSGPISAVLYLPIVVNKQTHPRGNPVVMLQSAGAKATELHALMNSALPCQLDLMLVYEYFTDDHASMLYPINILRNYARLMARTPFVGLFDADMLVSSTLFQKFQTPEFIERVEGYAANKTVLVIPGFITLPSAGLSREYIADRMSVANKSVIQLMYKNLVMQRFDPQAEGHNATQYSRWFESVEPYQVKYRYRYEPWVVAGRQEVPFYDVRFRGYGQNKIIHCEYMNNSNFKFVVDPDSWLTHRAHGLTRAKLEHANDARKVQSATKEGKWEAAWFQNVYGHTARLGNMTRHEMANGTYHPPLDLASAKCLKVLSWWKNKEVPA